MNDFKQKARELKDSQQYENAIELYEKVWETDKDKWVGYGLAFCYSKKAVPKLDEAIFFSKEVYRANPDFKINKDLLARILNDKYFRFISENITTEEANQLLDIVIYMGSIVEHAKETPLEFCSFRAIKAAKKHLKIKFPDKKVLEILLKLDTEKLSKDNYEQNINGRKMEIQSNYEHYYALKTAAYLALGKYEDCLLCCEEALNKIEVFHHDNDIWIKQRKAECLLNIGDGKQAEQILKELVLYKEGFFILSELAKVYIKLQEQEKALVAYCRALLTKEPYYKKVSVIEDFGGFLEELKLVEESQLHYNLAKKIREEKGWSTYKIEQKIKKKHDVSTNIMREIWLNKIYSINKVVEGKIYSIGGNGKNGFIEYSKERQFFLMKNIIGGNYINIGDKVKFVIVESFNKSKQIKSTEASYITKI